eukprot:Skav226161  [mRNA]  locus=scaffold3275:181311:181514:+ [translate_table: standard]
MNLALFSGITFLASTAKRQLERHERYSMLQLISERPGGAAWRAVVTSHALRRSESASEEILGGGRGP